MTEYSIFYNGNSVIDYNALNSIIESVVLFADTIWISSNATFSHDMPPQIKNNCMDIFKRLEEEGVIKKWSLPYFGTDDTVKEIPYDKYEEINCQISDVLLKNGQLLNVVSATDNKHEKSNKNVETTSKLISVRKDYWATSIADCLGANRVLIAPQNKNVWLSASEQHRYPYIEKKAIDASLKQLCQMPDLLQLQPDDIMNLHKKNNSFRNKICEYSNGLSTQFQYNAKTEEFAKKIQDDIIGYIDSTNQPKTKGIVKNLVYTAASAYLPVLSLLPFADEHISWLSKRREYGYIIFLSELNRTAKKQKNR